MVDAFFFYPQVEIHYSFVNGNNRNDEDLAKQVSKACQRRYIGIAQRYFHNNTPNERTWNSVTVFLSCPIFLENVFCGITTSSFY